MYSSELSHPGVLMPKSFHDTTAPEISASLHQERAVLLGEPVALGARIDRQQPLSLPPHCGRQRLDLVVGGEERRDVLTELADLVRSLARAQPGRPRVQRLLDDPHHGRDLVVGGGALERLLAHDVAAHRAVAHLREDVQSERAALQPCQVVGERLPTRTGRISAEPPSAPLRPR